MLKTRTTDYDWEVTRKDYVFVCSYKSLKSTAAEFAANIIGDSEYTSPLKVKKKNMSFHSGVKFPLCC